MSPYPLVSVCVPTFNYGRFLSDCIESVLEQTFSDWELIIVDDCSTDGTAEIVAHYSRSDSRIQYARNQKRLGMCANLKRAADCGRGQYLKILCADDWLAPRCLQVFVEAMERNPKVVLATSAEIHTDCCGVPLCLQYFFSKPVAIIAGETMRDRISRGEGVGGNSAFFIRATAYRAVGGYNSQLLYAADFELGARLCQIGDYLHLDEPLFYGREHAESSSSQDPKRLYDVIDRLTLPRLIFGPRRFPNREWRRCHRLSGLWTAHYLLSAGLEYLRGNRAYAAKLLEVIWRHGGLTFGALFVPFRLIGRLLRRLTGKHRSATIPPSPDMGTPAFRRRFGLRSHNEAHYPTSSSVERA